MAAVHAALSAQSDAAARADIDVLSAAELRERVLRLSGELAMRGRWEAMRLIEALEAHDKAWADSVSALHCMRGHGMSYAYVPHDTVAAGSGA